MTVNSALALGVQAMAAQAMGSLLQTGSLGTLTFAQARAEAIRSASARRAMARSFPAVPPGREMIQCRHPGTTPWRPPSTPAWRSRIRPGSCHSSTPQPGRTPRPPTTGSPPRSGAGWCRISRRSWPTWERCRPTRGQFPLDFLPAGPSSSHPAVHGPGRGRRPGGERAGPAQPLVERRRLRIRPAALRQGRPVRHPRLPRRHPVSCRSSGLRPPSRSAPRPGSRTTWSGPPPRPAAS